MTRTVREVFFRGDKSLTQKQAMFGVEVEVEFIDQSPVTDFVSANWGVKEDHSLRGGAEYVFKKPRNILDSIAAIDELSEILEGANISFSDRTSVHVHLNVRNLTFSQLKSLVYIYYLMEIPLHRFCGDVREGNNYCLRQFDSDEVVWVIKDFLKKAGSGLINDGNNYRYGALNVIYAVLRYGSVEFRGMRGTLDVDTLRMWLTIIEHIYLFARDNDWKDIVSMAEENTLFDKVFTKAQREALYYEGVKSDLAMSRSLAIDFLV